MSDSNKAEANADKIEQLVNTARFDGPANLGFNEAVLSCELSKMSQADLRDALKVMTQRESYLNNRPAQTGYQWDYIGNLTAIKFDGWTGEYVNAKIHPMKCDVHKQNSK